MNEAIDAGHVWVAYQPKVDIKTGMVCGAEALARWSDPERGEIPPDEFVLAAEAQNRIVKLTNFVLSEAAAVAARIVPINPHFSVAVNLSPRALDTNSVVTTVRTVLRQHKLAARHLTVELTETAGIEESPTASASLDALRKLGVRISIDDYGTGYSTLDYMTKIPAHEIKIDKTFIQKLVHSQPNRKVVASTIDLAHNMSRTVVVEGVEDEATLDVLAKMGCDLAQGYLMGKPMREDALMARIEASRPDLRRRAG